MRHFVSAFALSALCALATHAAEPLQITTQHGDAPELAVKARLEQTLGKYSLDHWLYTRKIVIDDQTWPPHSHPVLTLGVRGGLQDDDMALVTNLLHEEMHWNIVLNATQDRQPMVDAIKAAFPGAPTAPPMGSGGEASTYEHVLVCYLEYKALATVFGDAAALQSIQARPYYKWDYAIVADKRNHPAIDKLLADAGVHL